MGRGPHGMQVNDLIVVFLGAKVPFVVRKSGPTSRFLLVSECYVHGIMKGESVEDGIKSLEDISLI